MGDRGLLPLMEGKIVALILSISGVDGESSRDHKVTVLEGGKITLESCWIMTEGRGKSGQPSWSCHQGSRPCVSWSGLMPRPRRLMVLGAYIQ